ncbi:MAG: ketose-bisphosphate aldolase [Clostridia bacterium]|nr:ketose-bisphosphate aldolase [Clostridia bacterium]
MKDLLIRAEKENFAVGAFSVGNMEMVMGVIRAAEKLDTPVILQIAEKRLGNSPMELMAPMMVSAARNARVDVAVHLDHGLTLDCIKSALAYGFTSVMLDCSLKPLGENIEATCEVVRLAREYGATVEAELGVVGGNEGDTEDHIITCTDPLVAKRFCDETGIDALAVAIGNAHGNYPVLPELRFDVLEEIHNSTDVPLVLHGGTGITDEMFRKAISLGIRKINIATASFDALTLSAKQYLSDGDNYFALSEKMAEGVFNNVAKHINIFNNKEN